MTDLVQPTRGTLFLDALDSVFGALGIEDFDGPTILSWMTAPKLETDGRITIIRKFGTIKLQFQKADEPEKGAWSDSKDGWERFEENTQIFRRIKRYFGPLAEDGEPPYVHLRGELNRDRLDVKGFNVDVEVTGAFKCKVKKRSDVPLTDSDKTYKQGRIDILIKELSKGTKVETDYDCEPNV